MAVTGISVDQGRSHQSTAHGVQPYSEPSVDKLGYKVHYDPETTNAPFWKNKFAAYEPLTYNIFNRFMKNDTIVFDVGAWVGLTALWEGYAAKKVFAMEPTRHAFAELTRNLHANPELAGRVELINKALGAADDVKEMTNNDHAMDQILAASGAADDVKEMTNHDHAMDQILAARSIPVQVTSIDSLRKEYPELENTGFVKIDTEGYERVIVPALEQFFKEKKPVTFLSLHEWIAGREAIQSTVDKLAEIFPYLYEADMVTPFDAARESYADGDHGGVDVLCTWEKL